MFLRNDAINRVNLHSGIQALAKGAGDVFFLVFLLRVGVSIPVALLVVTAIFGGRFALRPLLLPLVVRVGVKPTFLAGAVGLAVQYLILPQVHGVGAALAALWAAAVLAELPYWVSYNTYFAALGDSEHRGHQIGAREAMIAAASIVAPLLGAWGLTHAGARPTFAVIAAVQAASALPLLGLPNLAVARQAPGAFRAARLGALLLAIDGWFDAGFIIIWQIALFVALGQSFVAYGGAMALAGLVGAGCGLVLGRLVDAGHGARAVLVAYSVAAGLITLRALSLGQAWLAIAANALGALLMPLLLPPLAGATYNLAKASPCPFRFQMATEAGWDLGYSAACLCAAALTALGAPLALPLILPLPGVAVGAGLLLRYYGARGEPARIAAD